MFATRTILAAIHAPEAASETTDAELLRRFAEHRDEGAFEAVVRRHARLVWGVCRRTLDSVPDAEDAFQAAFLVLARNPQKVRRTGTAAGFLFGVARRVALKSRTRALARGARAIPVRPGASADPAIESAVRELRAILDEEVARLPEACRVPFVLCVLEGASRARAAAELGVNAGTLSSRLARARLLLRHRLARRGVQLTTALAVTDLATVSAAPAALVRAAVTAGVSGRASGAVVALAGALGVRLTTGVLVGVVCAAAAVGFASTGSIPPNDPAPVPVEKPMPAPRVAADAGGDPLPAGAIARLGSARWRHEGEAKSVSFSPDGKTLAVRSGEDGAVTFFDAATGRVVHRMTDYGDAEQPPPGTIAFSPDGKFFAGRLAGGVVRLWDARTKKLVRTLSPGAEHGDDGGEYPMRFSPDGKRLAVCTPVAVVTIWDVTAGKVVATLTGHNHANPALAFSSDGKVVFLALSDPDVQLWDAETGKVLRGFKTGGPAFSIAVSSDGKAVASGGRDRIVVSEVETGKELVRLEAKEMGAALGLGFTPDGKSLVSFGEDAKGRVWDLATKKERFVLDSRGWIGRSMALSADGKTVAAGTVYNIVRVWDVGTGKELSTQADGHDAPVHAVAFAPDGRTLATGGANQQLRLWDAATLRQVEQFRGRSARQVSFSPDGSRLTTAWEWGDRACVWEVGRDDRPALELVTAGVKRCPCAAFAPDGKTVVTAAWRKDEVDDNFGKTILHVWDGVSGNRQSELKVPDLQPHALAVSPDGRWAALGGYAGNGSDPGASLRLCDLVRNRERPLRHGAMSYVVSVAFTPDSRLLVAGNVDRTVHVLELASGREIMTLNGHGRSVAAVAVAPGGRLLATADGHPISRYWEGMPPQTVRFWDVASGKELARLDGFGCDVTALAFHPDGKRLVGGLRNGTALVWETPAAARPPTAPARKLGPKELAALWGDLAGDDAAVAHDAVRILAASPEHSVPYLAGVLRPAGRLDTTAVRRRIADLGSEEFAVREAAAKELAAWGEGVEFELERALKDNTDAEVARRIPKLLTALRNAPPPDRLRELRAVWALELSGTPAVGRVLTELSKGAPDARLTREAKAALDRR